MPGAQKYYQGLDKKLLKCFELSWNRFDYYNFFAIFFDKVRITLRFLKILVAFSIFPSLQGPGNLLWGFLMALSIVSSNNGKVFNILMSRILAFSDEICNFFEAS